jgi:transposase-like protein
LALAGAQEVIGFLMTRAKLRAFKCRHGVHRYRLFMNGIDSRGTCRDCGSFFTFADALRLECAVNSARADAFELAMRPVPHMTAAERDDFYNDLARTYRGALSEGPGAS